MVYQCGYCGGLAAECGLDGCCIHCARGKDYLQELDDGIFCDDIERMILPIYSIAKARITNQEDKEDIAWLISPRGFSRI